MTSQNILSDSTSKDIPATFIQRLTTCLLDNLIVVAIATAISFAITTMLGLPPVMPFTVNENSSTEISSIISIIISILVTFLYYSLDLKKGTAGKIANNLLVIDDKTGKQITNSKNLLRTLCKQIPFISIISLFTINNRPDKKGLHDIIMKTSVVKIS